MLRNRSIARVAASRLAFGKAAFPEQSESDTQTFTSSVAAHGAGEGEGIALVGVEFMSPAQTGIASASASIIEANGLRWMVIMVSSKGIGWVDPSATGGLKLVSPGERMILAKPITCKNHYTLPQR